MNPVGMGVIGLGMAGAIMVRAAARHPGLVLHAAADLNPALRDAFARDFNARVYDDAKALCDDPAIEIVYIASPHQFHAEHALLAAERGKHVILEKPMALNLADCDRIIEAAERHGVHLIVGHTHGFDPTVKAMRGIIRSGELGRLAMISSWNYTNFLYRPRRPEELDTALGGGIMFNQVPHQIDTIRLLGGGMVRSVRAATGILDTARPTEGAYTSFLEFESGAAATMAYSGYDFFDSDELHFWVGEGGGDKQPGQHGVARRNLANRARPETELRAEMGYRGTGSGEASPHLPHFGVTIVTCEQGDMRPSADGLLVYSATGVEERDVARAPGMAGRGDVIDELMTAIRTGVKPVHDGRWGKATVEVALALLQSARERREIMLQHQVPVPEGS